MKNIIRILFFLGGVISVNQAWAGKTDIITSDVAQRIYEHSDITAKDIKIYKHIFRNIKQERIQDSDKEIKKLKSNALLGHVLAQKYLSQSYKTTAEELNSWLLNYPDYPQAAKIKNLYYVKTKKVYPPLKYHRAMPNTNLEKMSMADRRFVLNSYNKFRKAINKGKTKVAKTVLQNKRFKILVKNKDLDSLGTTLAMKYLTDGYNKLAFEWAEKSYKRSKQASSAWIAGLASWQLKQYKNAAKYFESIAKTQTKDEWMLSAGAYWAFRAYDRLGNKQKAYAMLQESAKYKRTFYGILGTYRLDKPITYDWTISSFENDFSKPDYVNVILSSKVLSRVVLLVDAKQKELAEKELLNSYKKMNRQQQEVAMFMAHQYKMHKVAMLIAKALEDDKNQISYDILVYPQPKLKPKKGWTIDKNLALAFIRQESSFDAKAKSHAGARGLMQLLPSTAHHISKDGRIKRNKDILYNTSYNLQLGQDYLQYLADKDYINGNLFYMMVAYNAGPGNLLKWEKKVKFNNDPLLFIEIIPAQETRIYVERVMSNYWIYEAQAGEPLTGIKNLLKGKWPYLKN